MILRWEKTLNQVFIVWESHIRVRCLSFFSFCLMVAFAQDPSSGEWKTKPRMRISCGQFHKTKQNKTKQQQSKKKKTTNPANQTHKQTKPIGPWTPSTQTSGPVIPESGKRMLAGFWTFHPLPRWFCSTELTSALTSSVLFQGVCGVWVWEQCTNLEQRELSLSERLFP